MTKSSEHEIAGLAEMITAARSSRETILDASRWKPPPEPADELQMVDLDAAPSIPDVPEVSEVAQGGDRPLPPASPPEAVASVTFPAPTQTSVEPVNQGPLGAAVAPVQIDATSTVPHLPPAQSPPSPPPHAPPPSRPVAPVVEEDAESDGSDGPIPALYLESDDEADQVDAA
ncbi:MAG: hypothetical protein INR71_11525 [Terriglobus roseus]|nr:hypothetical protein [Terriglobus roseus]